MNPDLLAGMYRHSVAAHKPKESGRIGNGSSYNVLNQFAEILVDWLEIGYVDALRT